MIFNKTVLLKTKGNNKLPYYRELGYNTKLDIIEVKVDDLNKTSNCLVEAKCDFCSNVYTIKYKSYTKNISNQNKYSCVKCKSNKAKLTNLIRYGYESPMQSFSIREKVKQTNLEKYGNEYTFNSKEIKGKIKNSILERYGVDNVFKLEEVQERIKQTNLERYGVDNVSKLEEVKEKIKKTNLEKYNSEYYVTSPKYLESVEFIREKIKQTNLEKYGTLHKNISEKYRIENFNNCKDSNYISYLSNSESIFHCIKGHNFVISSDTYRSRKINNVELCTICYPINNQKSIKEKELYNFIESIYKEEIIQSYRDGLEIDIYLPDLKIGFEFNGLYWHSEEYKDKNYHLNKTNYFRDLGIRIIHIWEDDWDFKKDIIKSQIINWLNLNTEKVFARKCEINEIEDNKLIREFLDKNHIQGYTRSVKKIGIFYKSVLIGLMTFDKFEGRKKMKEDEWNLSRFCCKLNTNVIGGASRLLKYFINKYKPKKLITYADRSWSNGDLYHKLGFKIFNESKADYKYLINKNRLHKSNFKKSNLNTTLSESAFMEKSNIYRIWDCGKIKFEYKFNT